MSDTLRPRRATRVAKADPDWAKYWSEFEAPETEAGGDGAADCMATLYYHPAGTIPGSTGTGHAEMVALDEFIRKICRMDPNEMRKYFDREHKRDRKGNLLVSPAKVRIECTAKPCCLRCSSVLGALKIGAMPGTFKTRRSMGSTQWGGLSPAVRGLICEYLEISQLSIEALAR